MQIELTFRIAPDQVPVLRKHPSLREFSPPSRAVTRSSTYFDTPGFLLREHGLSLHIMRSGKRWTQSLTDINPHDAEPFACDWDADVPALALDLPVLSQWLLHEARFKRCRFTETMLAEIAPIFTLDCRRTTWRVAFGEGRDAEVVLDVGEVKSGAAQQAISELTLTHQSGESDAFYEFALVLQHDLALQPVCRSVVQSGYALRDPVSCPPVTATRLRLPPDADTVSGMQVILRNCLTHICGNAAGAVYGESVECVHQMRVGLRRLRSALGIFESVIPCPAVIQTELAWLSAALGDARDWEVLDTVTIPTLSSRGLEATGIMTLHSKVHHEAMQRHHHAAVAVDSPRSARLWLMLNQWMTRVRELPVDAKSSSDADAISLRHFAEQHVRRFHKKALKRCEAMDVALPESRHRVRIASKRLRYATEFFSCYFRHKSASRFATGLADLQDVLGASNDIAVADKLLGQLAQSDPDLSEVCAYIRGYQAAVDDCRLLELGKRIRRFSGLKTLRLRDSA